MSTTQEQHKNIVWFELRQIAKGGSLAFFAQLLGVIISFGSGIVITRIVGAEALGVASYVLSILFILQVISVLGLDRGLLKFTSHSYGKNDYYYVDKLTKFSGSFAAISSVLFVLVFVLLIFFSEILPANIRPYQNYVVIIVCSVPFYAIFSIYNNVLVGLQAPQHGVIADRILGPLIKTLAVLILANFFSKISTISYATVLCYAFTFSYIFLFYKFNFGKFAFIGQESTHFVSFKDFLKFSLSLAVVPIFNLIGQKIDVIIMAFFINVSDIGVFYVAKNIAALVGFPLLSFGGVIAGTLSKLKSSHGHIQQDQQHIYATTTKWICFLSGLILCFVFICANDLLHLYGKDFVGGEPVVIILILGQIFFAWVGPTGYILLTFGEKRVLIFNAFLFLLFSVSFQFVFSKYFGLIGSACAVSFSIGLINVISALQIYFYLGLRMPSWKFYLFLLFSIAVPYLISILLSGHFIESNFFVKFFVDFISASFFFLVWGICFYFFRGFFYQNNRIYFLRIFDFF